MFRVFVLAIISFAFGNTIAQNWQRVGDFNLSSRGDDMFFVGNKGWVIGGAGRDYYRSVDYGQTWIKDTSYKFSNHLRSMEFFDENIGIISGFTVGEGDRHYHRTTDGGITWDTVHVHHPNFYGMCGIYITEDKTCFAAGVYFGKGYIMKSTDMALTWEITDFTDDSLQLVDVMFYDNNTGIVTGEGKTGAIVMRTTDAGENWDFVYQSTDGEKGQSGWKIDITADGKHTFISIQDYQSEQGAILKSSDMGLTWEKLPHNYPAIQGIAFWDGKHGVIGGWGMPITETEDGGLTWKEMPGTEDSHVNKFVKVGDRTIASGYSIFQRTKNPNTIDKNDIPNRKNLTISTNTTNGTTKLIFDAKETDQIKLYIYDINGDMIVQNSIHFLHSGRNEVGLNQKLAPGVYFISLMNVEGIYREKFIVEAG